MRIALAFAILLAACGDNVRFPDAAFVPACRATFSGNFDETSAIATDCAMLAQDAGGWTLAIEVPVAAFDQTLAISIGLGGAPAPGAASSATTAVWSARVVHTVGDGFCIYDAGSNSTPTGSFTLTIDTVDLAARRAHGTLALVLDVLTEPGSACGDPDTETLTLAF